MTTGKDTASQNETGSTLVEFALVLTLLLTLTFGMIDFGRYLYAVSVVRSAAQEGARAGIIAQATDADMLAATEAKIVALDLTRITVTPLRPSDDMVEVQVTYQFEWVTPFLAAAAGGDPVEISGSASMAAY